MTILYEYVQTTPATTWAINHNLNSAPISDVVDDTGAKILPDTVDIVDMNNVNITFTYAATGTARLIGMYQAPALVQPGTIDPGEEV